MAAPSANAAAGSSSHGQPAAQAKPVDLSGGSTIEHGYAHIRTGYRHGYSFRQVVRSTFEWHNETWNVWTHLLGCILFFGLLAHVAQMDHVVSFIALPEGAQALHLTAQLEKLHHSYETLRYRVRDGVRETHLDSGEDWARTRLEGHPHEVLLGRAALAMQNARRHLLELGYGISHLGSELGHELSHIRELAAGTGAPARLSEDVPDTRGACAAASSAGGTALGDPDVPDGATCDASRGTASDGVGGGGGDEGSVLASEAERRLDSQRVDSDSQRLGLDSQRLELERLLLHGLGELRLLPPSLEQGKAELRLGSAGVLYIERWPLYVFVASAIACLGSSAVFHLFGTANARWAYALGAFDYAGIIFLILGSTTPIYFYGFYYYDVFRRLYLGAICLCGGALLVCVQLDWFYHERWRLLRIGMFVGLGALGALPLLHVLVHHDFNPMSVRLASGVLAMGGIYLGGVVVYALGFPEAVRGGRFNQNSRFDIHLSSHQWWHAAVVLAAYVHFFTVLGLWHSLSLSHADATLQATTMEASPATGS